MRGINEGAINEYTEQLFGTNSLQRIPRKPDSCFFIVRTGKMSTPANPFKDQLAMYLISIGVIDVDKKGNVWQTKSQYRGILSQTKRRMYKNISVSGYIRVNYSFNGNYYNMFAHRIVWIYYKGIIPHDLEINHINGIKDDNRPENLELMTGAQNVRHSFKVLGRKAARGVKNGRAKRTENEIREIRKRYAAGGISQEKLGLIYNTSQGHIWRIVRGILWKHLNP